MIPDPDLIQIEGLDDKKFKKKLKLKEKFFLSKIAIYLSIGLHKGRQSYRRSPQPSKENIWHFKT